MGKVWGPCINIITIFASPHLSTLETCSCILSACPLLACRMSEVHTDRVCVNIFLRGQVSTFHVNRAGKFEELM